MTLLLDAQRQAIILSLCRPGSLRWRYSASSGSPSASSAVRRTPPETTHFPITFIRSVMSVEEMMFPARGARIRSMFLTHSISGPGPGAMPPKVVMGAPMGRILP